MERIIMDEFMYNNEKNDVILSLEFNEVYHNPYFKEEYYETHRL